jgi:hypothetical protein
MIHYLIQIMILKMSSHNLYTQIIKAIEYKRKCLKIDGKAPPSIFNTWNERAEYITHLPKSESEKVDMLKKIVFEMNMNMYI